MIAEQRRDETEAEEQKRDKEKEASNVEDVWKRGHGNGAQLTWLFLALVGLLGTGLYGGVYFRRRYPVERASYEESERRLRYRPRPKQTTRKRRARRR